VSVPRRTILSWAFYDWANSAFSTTVIAGFFPIFFKSYWGSGLPATESTRWLGYSLSVSALLVALIGPFLGAMADQAGTKKRSLVIFTALGTASTAGLAFVGEGNWQLAAILYVLATIGFLCSIIFYDSLLVGITDEKSVDVVSARGYALGYLGGGILFAVNAFAASSPETFGLSGKVEAVKLAFLTVAVWWAVFSIPLLLFVPEPPGGQPMKFVEGVRRGFGQLRRTFEGIRRIRMALLFLLAYWFYIDGVDTVIGMAGDFGKAVGFPDEVLITGLLMVQFVAFPFAILMGKLGGWWGPRKAILLCLFIYALVTVFGSGITTEPVSVFGFQTNQFYVLAIAVATVQGGVQALSRSFFARLIPSDRAAEFFGFYNMLGKFAAIIGPFLVATVVTATGDSRAGIQAILVLFLIGGAILLFVNDRAARQQ
jgi:UMF1 family MFS transporter